VREIALLALFAVHAAVFAHVYFRRGGRILHLLLTAGFVLLALFYAGRGWQSMSGVEAEPSLFPLLRWAGIALLAGATPPFLIQLTRRFR
jgi:hypothetical protein